MILCPGLKTRPDDVSVNEHQIGLVDVPCETSA